MLILDKTVIMRDAEVDIPSAPWSSLEFLVLLAHVLMMDDVALYESSLGVC